jgi:hypothetical protein
MTPSSADPSSTNNWNARQTTFSAGSSGRRDNPAHQVPSLVPLTVGELEHVAVRAGTGLDLLDAPIP